MSAVAHNFEYPDPPNPQAIIARAKAARAEALAGYGRELSAFVSERIIGPITAPYRRRKMRRELNGLDDRILADIGILRSDIPAIVDRTYRGGMKESAPLPGIEPEDFRWQVTVVRAASGIADAAGGSANDDGRGIAA